MRKNEYSLACKFINYRRQYCSGYEHGFEGQFVWVLIPDAQLIRSLARGK